MSLKKIQQAMHEVESIIVGQKDVIKNLFIALLSDGHLLIEGLPGLAKTLSVNTLAKSIDCDFKRIQFTPDLLPADLIGTLVFNPQESSFSVKKGPIFTQILLADEINRAPAKVQSALLEVMQEKQVTIGGTTYRLKEPFIVFATQNPIEHEGTYPLPEAQTDRFMMKIKIDYPTIEEEKKILETMANLGPHKTASSVINADDILQARKAVNDVYIDEKVVDYLLKIVAATREPEKYNIDLDHWLLFGASPRASMALKIAGKARAYLQGRDYVTPDDIKSISHDVLRHRLRRTFEAEAEEVTSDHIIDKILSATQVP